MLVNPIDHDGSIENQIMRSDLEFTKKGEDGQDRLAGVAFKLTSEATGESHVVVTDENGYFSSASSWNKHTHDTNGNDWALKADGVIDSSKLDAAAGVWFGDAEADDSKGALPYGTYAIEELRCTANEGYQLIETTVIVSRDGKVYDFGTLVDVKASITTKPYVMKGQLRLKDSGEPLEVDGKPVKAETTFTPESADGTVDVTFTFDSRGIGDKTDIVVFESLERCGTEIASHKDIEDGKQTVTVTHPEIGTTAVDGADGDKNVITDDTTEVIDTVEYTGLIPGKTYTLKGTLHVKVTDEEGNVTEKPLEVDGKPIKAETTFTPEKADGKVDVVFHFNSRMRRVPPPSSSPPNATSTPRSRP